MSRLHPGGVPGPQKTSGDLERSVQGWTTWRKVKKSVIISALDMRPLAGLMVSRRVPIASARAEY